MIDAYALYWGFLAAHIYAAVTKQPGSALAWSLMLALAALLTDRYVGSLLWVVTYGLWFIALVRSADG